MNKRLFLFLGSLFLMLVLNSAFSFALENSLQIGIQKNLIPLEYIDDQGEPRGIIVDIWKLWSVKTESSIEFIPLPKNTNVSTLETARVDIISNLGNLPKAESDGLRHSLPLCGIEYFIFSHKNSKELKDIGSFKNFKIGVIQDNFTGNLEGIGLPLSIIKRYPTNISLYHGLANGEVQAAVASEVMFRVALAKTIATMKVSQSAEPVTTRSIYAMVANDNEALQQKINLGLEKITPAEIQAIKSRWTGKSLGHRIQWQLLSFGILVAVAVIIGLVLWYLNFHLKEKIAIATKDLLENHQQLKISEENLSQLRSYLSNIIDSMPSVLIGVNMHGEVTQWNKMSEDYTGILAESVTGNKLCDVFPEMQSEMEKIFESIQTGKIKKYVNKPFQSGNEVVYQNLTIYPLSGGSSKGAVIILEDVTKEHDLEIQLQQSKKMEAIGQLAGGVAHDFNNMLGVILGHAEMAMENLDPTLSIFNDLNEIQKAAKRSAEITRQLLAFARKQTIKRKVIDLNETVESILKMLRRLIGEDIELVWSPSDELWPLKMDSSQIDQVLANLFVNARGAITGVGKIVVETGNKTFDEEYCATQTGYVPGEYVRLTVSDNGRGMSKETVSHIFEPFFTTKDIGEGTGLGLATVYGAVKQNNGFINVYSEPGQGTTFSIYLPRHQGEVEQDQPKANVKPLIGGKETILLVEDEPPILLMTSRMLQGMGYNVLTATGPNEAIRLAGEFSQRIDLLITDVIMPEMNGRDLAEKFLVEKSVSKCLFMSGYTADIITKHGIIDEKVCFIQKPFSKKDLAEKVRQILQSN